MELKIFSGGASEYLARRICAYLDVPLGRIERKRFRDGELWVYFTENIRGADVFLVQSTSQPHRNIMELLMMLDAARRASAGRITAVIPYFGYARQDSKDQPRVPVTAKLMANIIWNAGAQRILMMDLHQEQEAAFFDVPVDHLYARPVFVEHFNNNYGLHNLVVAAPDAGATKRARSFARRLGNCPVVLLDKRREEHNRSEIMHVVGDVRKKRVLMVDDIADTGGTLANGAKALLGRDAKEVYAFCTHGVFSGRAPLRLGGDRSPLVKMFVTDTHQRAQSIPKEAAKIEVLSVAQLLGESIRRIHHNESVSNLFK